MANNFLWLESVAFFIKIQAPMAYKNLTHPFRVQIRIIPYQNRAFIQPLENVHLQLSTVTNFLNYFNCI